MFKPGIDLAIWSLGDVARLECATKFIECLLHDFSSLLWIACGAFVINCELFVCFIAMPRVSDRAFPKFTSQFEITLALGESRERSPRRSICFSGQKGSNGFLVERASSNLFPLLFANARDAKQFESILSQIFRIAE